MLEQLCVRAHKLGHTNEQVLWNNQVLDFQLWFMPDHKIHVCARLLAGKQEIWWIPFLMRPHRGCKTQTAILWPYVPVYIIRRIIYLDAARERI